MNQGASAGVRTVQTSASRYEGSVGDEHGQGGTNEHEGSAGGSNEHKGYERSTGDGTNEHERP